MRRQRRRRPNLRQRIAEIPYRPARCRHTYLLIIRRQRIEKTDKQGNLIEQLQNGLAGLRMPTGKLLSNAATYAGDSC